MTTSKRNAVTRYRIDRVGNVVRDTRTMSAAYLDPIGQKYETGHALHVGRKSSPARVEWQARHNRKAQARVAIAAIKAASNGVVA